MGGVLQARAQRSSTPDTRFPWRWSGVVGFAAWAAVGGLGGGEVSGVAEELLESSEVDAGDLGGCGGVEVVVGLTTAHRPDRHDLRVSHELAREPPNQR